MSDEQVCPFAGTTLDQSCVGKKRRASGFCIVCDIPGAVDPKAGTEDAGVVEGGDALAKGVEGDLGADAQVRFGEDVLDVGAHGGLANGQPAGYLQDAVSLGHEAEGLDLPVDREPYCVGRDETPEPDRYFACVVALSLERSTDGWRYQGGSEP